MGKAQKLGRRAEVVVAQTLRDYGRDVSVKGHKSPFDLLVDGARVEVKCAEKRIIDGVPTWTFNLHRHGVLNEASTDLYIFRLEHVPFSKYAIHLLYRAPLNAATAAVSFRSLLNKDAIAVVDYYRFAHGKMTRPVQVAA